ncbi:receptor-like serine/threonine-protein kinase ALE2 [Elaeis guineensis]|uniref:Receptor-like serine/threonine-protein kinase ALE2 isoform X1 n=1 Tax=Elaeis guineensis var. tenera TaxID=51953 RepID=A0A6I9S738_ELAGV|nr:receptor-like serine/threonine-protein kinase ALE2 isoform X1 [Elaeis guineensis]
MRSFGDALRICHCRGLLKSFSRILVLNYLLIVLYLELIAEAKLSSHKHEATVVAPAASPLGGWNPVHSRIASAKFELPLPASVPLIDRRHRKLSSSQIAPSPVLAPPGYGSLTTKGHPSLNSSQLSDPSMQRNNHPVLTSTLVPSPAEDSAPVDSNSSSVPSGLAEPPSSRPGCCEPDTVQRRGAQDCHCVYPVKVELFLLNGSLNSNWINEFLQELASQLNLQVTQFDIINIYVVGASGLNITMNIAPQTGISFSKDKVDAMNSSLALHRVHIGNYRLLNFTWFKPVTPASAPIMSPTVSPPAMPHLPMPSSDGGGDKNHSSLLIIVGICVGVVIIAFIMVLIICSCMSGKGRKRIPVNETPKPRTADAVSLEGSFCHPTSVRFLAYEELKEATNNFEAASVLGEGGFGRVFKGVLSDGTAVAIKKLSSGGHQGDKEFLVEVEMLSRLHHRNLVKLVGYYSSRDSSQNLLCYELVPNGSLESWLHGPLGANCPLDWDTRMKIALDAARGLAYLHEDSQPRVIHRDFKASNILLEHNFHAKVSDFGLAKQAPEGRANYLSTRVMGTFGYVAPEYAMTGHLLVKSDVYSYGVVLLELLTGRKPVDMLQPSGQENLVTWARPILRDKDRLEELADPRLAGNYPKDDFVRVCTIAAACVAPEASQRPTMGEVVQSLKMVQRVIECQDTMPTPSARPNVRQSSTTYESDGTSSMFSSGPFSGLSLFDNENISRTAVFSEDLHEGR